MILIADSGTTKTEWALYQKGGVVETILTTGINPFYQDTQAIVQLLEIEFPTTKKVDSIYFYGAGCLNPEKGSIVHLALEQFFGTEQIIIGSDLQAAAYALCQNERGIACILGTGSNSCLYDGEKINEQVSPLGFILGDEGSGAALGKQLIGDILKRQLSDDLILKFNRMYQLTPAEILEHVYRKPFPSRYLAGFTRFLSQNIDQPEIEQLVLNGFRNFVKRNLLNYSGVSGLPIHFTGSIAFYFQQQLKQVLNEFSLTAGKIEINPIPGLIHYHQITHP